MDFPNGSDRRNKGRNLNLSFVAKYFTVGDENLGNIRIVKIVHFILALFVGCLSLGATKPQHCLFLLCHEMAKVTFISIIARVT